MHIRGRLYKTPLKPANLNSSAPPLVVALVVQPIWPELVWTCSENGAAVSNIVGTVCVNYNVSLNMSCILHMCIVHLPCITCVCILCNNNCYQRSL